MKTKSMFARFLSVAVVVCVVLGCMTVAQAETIVDPATITATASVEEYPEHAPIMAVNGAGLSGGLHVKSGNPTSVLIGPYNGSWDNRWFLVDLGAEYSLKEMWVWNGGTDNWPRATKDVDIYYSTDPAAVAGNPWAAPTWTLLTQLRPMPTAATPWNVTTQLALADPHAKSGIVPMEVTARVIGLKVYSNYGDVYGASINELQFVVAGASSTPGTLIYGK